MSIKSITLSVALISSLVPLGTQVVQAATVPANYAAGVVSAVDAHNGTLTVDGNTFAAKTNTLGDIMPGTEVDVAYVTVNGVKQAISIELVGAEDAVDLVD